MRRGSLVGPFILIAIGVVLLVNNLRPELSLLELLSGYWPALLILWGVLRLVEILIGAVRSQPLPRAGISGGEWVLVVIIALVGSGTHFARANWPHERITIHGLEIFGEPYDFPVSGRQEAGEAPRIYVENLRGNVRLIGGDTQEVKVEGRTTIRAFNHEDAAETNQECPLEIVTQGGQIRIRTNHDRVGGNRKLTTDLEITVPKGATVTAHGRYGDFDISNITGDVEITSDNAGVRLTEIGGSARLNLKRSDIIRIVGLKGKADLSGRGEDVELENIEGQVTINGSYSGELIMRNLAGPLHFESRRTEFRVERTPGQIRMALGNLSGENLVGPIILKTGTRDVQLTNFTNGLEIEVDRGDIEIRPGGEALPSINVQLRSGDIRLVVSKSAQFGIEAEAKHGEVINEYGPALSVEAVGSGARLNGPEGKEINIRLKTDRGEIVIRRSGGTGEAAPKRLESTSA